MSDADRSEPMPDAPNLSVLIATHNRAESLRITLDAFNMVDRSNLSVEIVVIDNNSADHTQAVVESFAAELPVRYLFEPRPGKNCALNLALNQSGLGDLIVFMDDDITPAPNCLQAICATSNRWPGVSVFGGRIELTFPEITIPEWALDDRIQPFAFGLHQQTGGEGPYPSGVLPFGGLFWVRHGVFDGGRRFDESVGPRPTNRVMGSETTFLRTLVDDGYEIVYGPDAVVHHRVQKELFHAEAMRRRAYRQGRGTAYWRGPALARLYGRSRILWFPACVLGIAISALLAGVARLSPGQTARMIRTIRFIKHLGHCIESLHIAVAIKHVDQPPSWRQPK